MPSSRFAPRPFTIRRKVLLGFGSLLALFAVIAFIATRSTFRFLRTAQDVAAAHEVLELAELAKRHLTASESAQRGYLSTDEERWLTERLAADAGLQQSLAQLEEKGASPAALAAIRADLERNRAQHAQQIEALRTTGSAGALALFRDHAAADLAGALEQQIDALEAEPRRALDTHAEVTRSVSRFTLLAIATGTVLTFAALLFGCSMILRDIAARRRAEEALAGEHNLLSSIMDTMPNHVFVKDAKGRFILDNAAHRRYLGLGEMESIEGRSIAEYFPEAVAEKVSEDDRFVLETGQPILNREQLIPLAGRENWLETTKVPLRDTDGSIIGLVGISSDITQRKTAEEQLVRFAAQLERSNAELANFASVASHDLQEPLRKIQAFGDRLRAKCSTALSEQGLDYLARMQNAAERMQVLIQDLLKLSRVTSRAQPFEPCDLNRILGEVLSDLEVAIESQQARVEKDALPVIDGDPLQLRQLLQNLIVNALKFHRPGEAPHVEIRGRLFDLVDTVIPGAKPGDRACELTVRDHGIGFEQKFADQIFVVFQRLHSRAEYEGTGIGLAVCRKITDRHGGSIVAYSSPGEGASFVVTLPVKQPSAETHETKRSDADHDPDGR